MLVSRRHHQDAALAEKPGAFRHGQRNAAELRAGHVGDAVMLRELLVQKRVVGTPELDRVAVVTQLTEQEQLGFLGQGIAQGDVVVGEVLLVRIGFGERIELQPREEEARDEGLGAIVGEHALHLPFESGAIAQAIAARASCKSVASGALFQSMLARRVAISRLLAAAGGFVVCTERLLDGE